MRRIVTLLAVAMLLAGAAMLIQAANMPRFTDPAAFRERLAALVAEHSQESERQSRRLLTHTASPNEDSMAYHRHMREFERNLSKRYWPLLDAYQSNKFKLQDYGGTALLAGVVLLLAGPFGDRAMRTPPRSGILQVAMFLPAVLLVGALVVDYQLLLGREEYPPWADLIATPILMAGMFGVPLSLLWMGVHQLLLPEVYYRSQPLALAFTWRVNPWLGFQALLAILMIAVNVWQGSWWWTIVGLAWLYAWLALAATRRASYLYADLESEWPPAWNTR